FVLKKKLAGKLLLQTAHQVEREYTALATIHKHNLHVSIPIKSHLPIPQVFMLCKDCTVISMPFYIMEFL
ncbi:hypothetical protein EI94DRAFT_1428267, partial [Lactarius quietus]